MYKYNNVQELLCRVMQINISIHNKFIKFMYNYIKETNRYIKLYIIIIDYT